MPKLTSLKQAISEYVTDGDVVYAAGFTHLIPFAAGHEIIRQGKKNLTLARATKACPDGSTFAHSVERADRPECILNTDTNCAFVQWTRRGINPRLST